jgi:uncharacterized protein YaaQ
MDRRLYKLSKFTKSPQEIVILGDSRGDSLHESLFRDHGYAVSNLAYGGGTLYEAVDTFWYAATKIKLNHVIFVLPFNLFSDENAMNLVPNALRLLKSYLAYSFDFAVTKASFFVFYNLMKGEKLVTQTPSLDKDAFWQHQLSKEVTGRFYGAWKTPAKLTKKLKEVAEFCINNGIHLLFVSPPTHYDLQKKISEFGLVEDYAEYKRTLDEMGFLIDYDVVNDMTRNKENFTDPYHFNNKIASDLVKEIAIFLDALQASAYTQRQKKTARFQ